MRVPPWFRAERPSEPVDSRVRARTAKDTFLSRGESERMLRRVGLVAVGGFVGVVLASCGGSEQTVEKPAPKPVVAKAEPSASPAPTAPASDAPVASATPVAESSPEPVAAIRLKGTPKVSPSPTAPTARPSPSPSPTQFATGPDGWVRVSQGGLSGTFPAEPKPETESYGLKGGESIVIKGWILETEKPKRSFAAGYADLLGE